MSFLYPTSITKINTRIKSIIIMTPSLNKNKHKKHSKKAETKEKNSRFLSHTLFIANIT